jgi:hypothetical protein
MAKILEKLPSSSYFFATANFFLSDILLIVPALNT